MPDDKDEQNAADPNLDATGAVAMPADVDEQELPVDEPKKEAPKPASYKWQDPVAAASHEQHKATHKKPFAPR